MHSCSTCHLTLVTCRGGLARGGSGSGTPSHAETVVGVKGKSGAKWRNQSEQLRIAMAASQGGPQVWTDQPGLHNAGNRLWIWLQCQRVYKHKLFFQVIVIGQLTSCRFLGYVVHFMCHHPIPRKRGMYTGVSACF